MRVCTVDVRAGRNKGRAREGAAREGRYERRGDCRFRLHRLSLPVALAAPIMFLFFFQAEDGIRDYKVTGVQTCALPICQLSQVPQTGGPALRVLQLGEEGQALLMQRPRLLVVALLLQHEPKTCERVGDEDRKSVV